MKKIVILIMIATMSISLYGQRLKMINYDFFKEGRLIRTKKQTNNYDTNGYLKSELSQIWDTISSSWIDQSVTEYVNNSKGLKDLMIIYNLDSLNTFTKEAFRAIYSYNEFGKLDTTVLIDTLGDNYKVIFRRIYLYDVEGNLISMIKEDNPSLSNTWVNSSKISYTYGQNGMEKQEVYQNWDSNINDWIYSNRKIITYYAEDKPLLINNEGYRDSVWVLLSKDTYTYDENGALGNINNQYINKITGLWINRDQINYINNNDGAVQQVIRQRWDTIAEVWGDFLRETYEYEQTSSINNAQKIGYDIYPNPCIDKLNVVLGENKGVKITISDIQGRVLKSGVYNSGNLELDVRDLPANMYFMRVEDGEKVRVEKIVKG